MRTVWILALLLGAALILGGCLGGGGSAGPNATNATTAGQTPGVGQIINNTSATPAAPSTPSAPNVSPGTEPQTPVVTPPASAGQPVIDPKKALKISMLRKGEQLSFGRSQVQLDGIYYKGSPVAQYELLDQSGNSVQKFELTTNQTFQFTGPDGVDYIVAAVFVVGQGIPNAVQTQIYRAQDLTTSAASSRIGAPENSYTITLQYPAPVLLANQSAGIGQTVSAPAALGAQLMGVDRSLTPAVASVRILDAAGAEIGTASLRNGQMVEVRVDAQNRYDVALQLTGTGSEASLLIYRVMAFQSATYNTGSGSGGY